MSKELFSSFEARSLVMSSSLKLLLQAAMYMYLHARMMTMVGVVVIEMVIKFC